MVECPYADHVKPITAPREWGQICGRVDPPDSRKTGVSSLSRDDVQFAAIFITAVDGD